MGLATGRAKARTRMETQAEVVRFLARGGMVARFSPSVRVGPMVQPRSFLTLYTGSAHVVRPEVL